MIKPREEAAIIFLTGLITMNLSEKALDEALMAAHREFGRKLVTDTLYRVRAVMRILARPKEDSQ